MARIGNKKDWKKKSLSRGGERKKNSPQKEIFVKKAWSSFKDFQVDESFYCSIFGQCVHSSLLTFLSTKEWMVFERRGKVLKWGRINSSLLVTRNLTPQQVVEFQPRGSTIAWPDQIEIRKVSANVCTD